jgi:hypothetical protein
VKSVGERQMLLVSLVALTCACRFATVLLLRDGLQQPASLGESTRGQYGVVMSCFPLLIFRCQSGDAATEVSLLSGVRKVS